LQFVQYDVYIVDFVSLSFDLVHVEKRSKPTPHIAYLDTNIIYLLAAVKPHQNQVEISISSSLLRL